MGELDRIARVGRNIFDQAKRALHEATGDDDDSVFENVRRRIEEESGNPLRGAEMPAQYRVPTEPQKPGPASVVVVNTTSVAMATEARDVLLDRLLQCGRISPERVRSIRAMNSPEGISESLTTLVSIVTKDMAPAGALVTVPGSPELKVSKEFLPLVQKILLTDPPEETFDDIKGQQDAVEELRAIAMQIKDPESLKRWGLEASKGVLLAGPGGVGKTMSVKALANEVTCPVMLITASEIFAGIVGESEKNVRSIFAAAREVAKSHPSGKVLLFFDEVDSIVPIRGSDVHEVTQKVVNLFLNELDGIKSDDSVIVIGATNRTDRVDGAFLSRLNRKIEFSLPTEEVRRIIVKSDFEKRSKMAGRALLATKIDWDEIAERTESWGGRDLKKIAREILKNKWWDAEVDKKKESRVTTADILAVVDELTPDVIDILGNQGLVVEAQRLKLSFLKRKAAALDAKESGSKPVEA